MNRVSRKERRKQRREAKAKQKQERKNRVGKIAFIYCSNIMDLVSYEDYTSEDHRLLGIADPTEDCIANKAGTDISKSNMG